MTVGFDIDGVLASFERSYQRLCVEVTGRDLFPPDMTCPPVWDWPEHFGYTKEETAKVWDTIKGDNLFWFNLEPTEHAHVLYRQMPRLELEHDVYYITSRLGEDVKRQTEAWLRVWVGALNPTVLIASGKVKGDICRALKVDAYIDDNLDNVNGIVAASPTTRTYRLRREYNLTGPCDARVRDVDTLEQYLAAEGLDPVTWRS